jgi:hypothetical protein
MACGWLNWGMHDHPQANDVNRLTCSLWTARKRLGAARSVTWLGSSGRNARRMQFPIALICLRRLHLER